MLPISLKVVTSLKKRKRVNYIPAIIGYIVPRGERITWWNAFPIDLHLARMNQEEARVHPVFPFFLFILRAVDEKSH